MSGIGDGEVGKCQWDPTYGRAWVGNKYALVSPYGVRRKSMVRGWWHRRSRNELEKDKVVLGRAESRNFSGAGMDGVKNGAEGIDDAGKRGTILNCPQLMRSEACLLALPNGLGRCGEQILPRSMAWKRLKNTDAQRHKFGKDETKMPWSSDFGRG